MNRRLIAAIAAAFVSLAAATTARVARPPRPADPSLLDELDAHIQLRFQDVNNRLGFNRIAAPGDFHETLRRFKPENEEEERTIAALERAGLNVVVYLAGRALLFASAPADEGPPPLLRRVIAGPVVVSAASWAAPPPARDLFDEGRRAFARFEREGTHTFSTENWSFVVRPVRASRNVCLKCHNNAAFGPTAGASPILEVGDALGVVFYGYRGRLTGEG